MPFEKRPKGKCFLGNVKIPTKMENRNFDETKAATEMRMELFIQILETNFDKYFTSKPSQSFMIRIANLIFSSLIAKSFSHHECIFELHLYVI